MDKDLENQLIRHFEELGDAHMSSGVDTPLREDAFVMDDSLKIELIAKHFREIMHVLGLDLQDESLKGTPLRVAKMYVMEQFKGLDPRNKPAATLFENPYNYKEMLVERNIHFHSTCEHHFVPIFGHAHVAYFSAGKVIGLSKLNRIVDYYARRPQVQERMTVQVASELMEALQTPDVAVIVDAKHMCVASRGIKDITSTTVTSSFHGKFNQPEVRVELLKYISMEDPKN